jgi:hypothetical protein
MELQGRVRMAPPAVADLVAGGPAVAGGAVAVEGRPAVVALPAVLTLRGRALRVHLRPSIEISPAA